MTDTFASWVVGGGAGALLGGILVAIINGLFGKGKNRAEAAKIISDAASNWVDRLESKVNILEEKIDNIADAVSDLNDKVDHVVPLIEPEHPVIAGELRAANRRVRRVI